MRTLVANQEGIPQALSGNVWRIPQEKLKQASFLSSLLLYKAIPHNKRVAFTANRYRLRYLRMKHPDPKFLDIDGMVRELPEIFPSKGSARWFVFNAKPRKSTKGEIPGNGFADAILRFSPTGGKRGKLLLDVPKFFELMRASQRMSSSEE